MLATNQHVEAQFNHVPGVALVVVHEIQSKRDMRVAVVTEEIVLIDNTPREGLPKLD